MSVFCALPQLLAGISSLAYLMTLLLSVIGMIVCISWTTLLTSYSDLNSSKMAIIACIEEHLALKLYDTEWAILTRTIGNKKYKSFTVKEKHIAKIFGALYGLILAASLLMLIIL